MASAHLCTTCGLPDMDEDAVEARTVKPFPENEHICSTCGLVDGLKMQKTLYDAGLFGVEPEIPPELVAESKAAPKAEPAKASTKK